MFKIQVKLEDSKETIQELKAASEQELHKHFSQVAVKKGVDSIAVFLWEKSFAVWLSSTDFFGYIEEAAEEKGESFELTKQEKALAKQAKLVGICYTENQRLIKLFQQLDDYIGKGREDMQGEIDRDLLEDFDYPEK